MLPYFVNNGGQGQATPQGCTLQIPCTDPRQKHSSQGILSISPPCLEPSLPILPAEMESSYSSAMPMETDMMSQFLGDEAHGHHCFAYEQQDESMEAMAAMFLPGLDTDSNSSSSCLNYDMSPQCWPQPQPGHSSSVTSFLDPAHGYESFEFPVMEPFLHAEFQSHCTDIPYLGGEDLSPVDGSCAPAGGEEAANDHTPVTNKRKSRAATTASKKAKKACKKDFTSNDIEGDDTYVIDPQSSSSCTSEDGDLDGNAKSSSKKTGTRASRGAATDPQSLYARKRRERINERLKTLQNLVPNGTKVDISTMLEEAVEYVKFMQLQIKLLSSDDMWMYAPLAYNGINVSSLEMHIAALQK